MKLIPVRNIHSSIKEPDTSGEFIIWDLCELLSGRDMVQDLHRHGFYFLLIIENGTGEHTIDFISYPFVARSIYLMRPGQVHKLTLNSNCKGYLLQFTDEFCLSYDITTKQTLKKICQRSYYQTEPEAFERISSLMTAILREISEKKYRYEYAIQINVQLLFVELLRQVHSLTDVTDGRKSYQSERLEEFKALIADHVSDHKQIFWYAERMNLTTYQLNTLSKRALGKSGSELITEYILLEAKRYLLGTTNQVSQISLHLGYEDISYFIRFFKKHTGYSPEAFRNNFK
ncbi:helix-turn-helix domain-containing protein [Pararcticibacter amylolyticus]|uniref:AraC family transcriptional regulator n=1 Tax=Pararcticibacter amylolyticus TaxID=2173175 RepID=A0A2U2PKL1_9SPHI|nr:helix-turn-helix domain-containing protein [Pararcticibacter amylolyticus]PWG81814.1 AraC family transcriptional regulator [Pararcticibacter amylolyticus]